ncbi:MAG: hypothetical protein E6659_01780 [Staphylococcus epidermidis]|nr:hypothetical protein [Staphylococcus epidermidis]MDU6514673.1 hypothetical protein [Staphylococcus epidermidis]
MKAKEIRDLTTSEIEEQIKSIRTVRKTIARLKTVAREREIEQSKANQ